MSRRPRSAPLLPALALLVAAGLVGCSTPAAPTSPSASPSRRPSPVASASPSAAVTVAKVVITGKDVKILDTAGEVLTSIPFTTDPAAAAQQISAALKETAVDATNTTDACYPELDESSWGALHIWSTSDGLTRPESALFFVTADGATTSGALPIQIPSGQAVGATKGAVLSANPTAPSNLDGESIDVDYDVVSGTPSGDPGLFYGALAQLTGGKLALITSPIYYSRPC